MVFENNCTQLILFEFPEFEKSLRWKEFVNFWGEDKPGICSVFSEFSHFISDELKKTHSNIDFVKVFNFIEKLIIEGEQGVQDAAATCFLENLINFTSSSFEKLPPNSFIHLLGPESREYCKAWDEFTGVKTEGLWD